MLNRIKVKHSIDKLKNNSKIKVYKVFQGRRAFELGRDMIFVNPEEWMSGDSEKDTWESKWSDSEKSNAVLIIFGKTPINRNQIGIKLLVGSDENYNAVGEIYDEKKAIKRWKDFITFY